MAGGVHLQSHHAISDHSDQNQGTSSGSPSRVPSDWLSRPMVRHTSVLTPPPCTKDVREMFYGPISGNSRSLEIRLIEIEDTDDEHGRMSCLLRSFPLSRAPEFRALSYCWNDSPASTLRKAILINSYEFRVQLNLWDALHMLRRHGYNSVWIDAICFNQQDDDEKAQQIPHMRLIYQQAVEVVIWLGNESSGSTKFLCVLQSVARSDNWQIRRDFRNSMLPIQKDEYRGVFPNLCGDFVNACLSHLAGSQSELAGVDVPYGEQQFNRKQTHKEFQGLCKAFFERPYWRRTWIVQEIASSRRLRIVCGDVEVGWEDLSSALIMDDGIQSWSDEADIGLQNIRMIHKLRYKTSYRIPIGFLTALQRSYGCEAGDMRDKFYALLGLCWDAELLMPFVSDTENATLNQIMFDLMQQWIKIGKLDVICLQPHEEDNNYNLPSWLPKWLTVGKSTMNERLVDHIESRRPVALLSAHGYSCTATKRSKGSPKFSDCNRIMVVKGKIIDMIDGLSAACDHFWKDPSLQKCWHSKSLAPETSQHMKQIRFDLYWTLNMYKERDGYSLADQALALDFLFSEETIDFWQHSGWDCLITWLEQIKEFKIFGRPFHQWLLNRSKHRNQVKVKIHNALLKRTEDKVIPATQEEKLANAFSEVFDDHRRLMTTTGGRVGWAHPSARPGDSIVLLEGCDLPVILAKSGIPYNGNQTYAVVGDAYVHGIMRGELWEAASSDLSQIFLR